MSDRKSVPVPTQQGEHHETANADWYGASTRTRPLVIDIAAISWGPFHGCLLSFTKSSCKGAADYRQRCLRAERPRVFDWLDSSMDSLLLSVDVRPAKAG